MLINDEVLCMTLERAKALAEESEKLKRQIERRQEEMTKLSDRIKQANDMELATLFGRMTKIFEQNNRDILRSQQCVEEMDKLSKIAKFMNFMYEEGEHDE